MAADRLILQWREPTPDGYGEPVRVEVTRADHEYLRDLWEQIKSMPPGHNRTAKVNELRIHMDLRAHFGGEFIDEVAAETAVPIYLAHDDEQVEEPTPEPVEAQTSLLEDVSAPQIGKWVAGQTDTLRETAIAIYPKTGSQRAAVLEAFLGRGDLGFTDDELAAHTGALRARTRRQELIEDFHQPIIDSGRRRLSDAGHPAAVWVYVP